MRSYNNMYERMLDKEYIEKCFRNAAKGKTERRDVKKVFENIGEETEILYQMLLNELFVPHNNKACKINDGNKYKIRYIVKPHYKYDQVIHHCVIGQFKDIVMNGLYEYSCGSIPGRGIHYGKKYMRKWIDSYKGKKMYVLKMDIRHFFESIDREILKEKLRKVIRDNRFYNLLCVIIESDVISEIVKIIENIDINEEDVKRLIHSIAVDKCVKSVEQILGSNGVVQRTIRKIKQIVEKKKNGLPLGFFTSQWFANFYLKAFDHIVKEVLKAKHYMRYMDDMVILGANKKKLHAMRKEIETILKEKLKLELKSDWQVFRFEYIDQKGKAKGRMLDFMGFQFHCNRTTLRKTILERIRRKALHIAKLGKISWYNASAMLSYMGSIKHADVYGYYAVYIKDIINIKKLKRIVSKHSKRKEQKNAGLERSKRIAEGKTGGTGYGIKQRSCVPA